ncbi:MAG TPA: hypothetical protein VGG79_13675 [Roseiarcus sp.]|jgi:hypothetical protein
MFEKAVIPRGADRDIDIGLIAETILFYGKTQLLLNRGVLDALTKIPYDDLLELSSRGSLNLSYVKPTFAVLSTGLVRAHSFVAFEHGPKERKRTSTFQEEISDAFLKAYADSRLTRKAITKFIDRVELFRHPGFSSKENLVCELTGGDVIDPYFVKEAAAAILRSVAPAYRSPVNFRFEVIDTGNGYVVSSDLDFQAISKLCLPPFTNDFTSAHVLGFIQDARADTFFAAHYMAELVTTSVSSEIIRLKHYDWLRRGDASRKEINLFTEIICNKLPSIREAIMSGNRSIVDYIKLLDRAEKFKKWIQVTNPDQGLINAYIREATSGSWADKISTKAIRIAVLQAIGLGIEAIMPIGMATTASAAVSAGDTFLLDRIAKGWRPAHFINGPYKKFVDLNTVK